MKRTGSDKSLRNIIFFSFLVVSILVLSLKAHAVFVAPTYVAFQDGQRSARIIVYNRGNETKVVTFTWQRIAVTEDGTTRYLEEGEESPGYRPADPFIRFSPRRVVLEPRKYQKIRLMALRPPDMEPGEYRSHFLVNEAPLKKASAPEVREGTVGGVLAISIGRSVPVFLRHGKTTVNVGIQEAVLFIKEGEQYLRMKIANDSTRSLYGKIILDCQMPDGTTLTKNFLTIRIYTEAKRITQEVPLKDMPVGQCTNLTAKLIGNSDFEYSGKILDEIAVALN